MSHHPRLVALVPFVFVLLWSTGFIGAKYALPYMEPFNLLFVRMLLNMVVFLGLIYWFKAKRLSRAQMGHQMVVGLLVHGGYLGGVFAAIGAGMPAGISALIVGLQPIITAVLVWPVFGKRLNLTQWLGLLLGLLGVAMVLHGNGKLGFLSFDAYAFSSAIFALLAISIGTMYQKHFGAGTDPLSGSFFQYLSTAVLMGVVTECFETGEVVWSLPLVLSMAWLVLGLSVAAVLLLMFMIKEGETAKVAAYFYLVPPAAAIQAWILFGEQFSAQALMGVVVTVIGVYLAVRQTRAA